MGTRKYIISTEKIQQNVILASILKKGYNTDIYAVCFMVLQFIELDTFRISNAYICSNNNKKDKHNFMEILRNCRCLLFSIVQKI